MKAFLRLKQVVAVTGLGRSTIYKGVADGSFPKQVKISNRLIGWHEDDVIAWQNERRGVGGAKEQID